MPPVPEGLLAEGFRRAALQFLAGNKALSGELRAKLLGWRHFGGFSAHHRVRAAAEDREGRMKLTGYMLRAPMSLAKVRYDAATGMVIYRSKRHAGLKRNFHLMPGAEWLELLCKHIPERYEHLVRYCGWYSNRARGERVEALKAQDPATKPPASVEYVSESVARAKAAWPRLIRKVYEVDPLACPRCKGPMRVIALIDDPGVVRRILEHLGHWAPEPAARGPPAQTPDWPASALIALTYHAVPDIA